MAFLPKIVGNSARRQLSIERRLIKFESTIGQTLFGEIPKGHQREFFCLDARTWIWHEGWRDRNGYNSVMTKYILRPKGGIIKSQNSGSYKTLSQEETANLLLAIKKYISLVSDAYHSIMV